MVELKLERIHLTRPLFCTSNRRTRYSIQPFGLVLIFLPATRIWSSSIFLLALQRNAANEIFCSTLAYSVCIFDEGELRMFQAFFRRCGKHVLVLATCSEFVLIYLYNISPSHQSQQHSRFHFQFGLSFLYMRFFQLRISNFHTRLIGRAFNFLRYIAHIKD